MSENQISNYEPRSNINVWSIRRTITALVAAVPLLALAGAGVWKLVEFGKTQATAELQMKEIDDLRADKLALQKRIESLDLESRSLDIKLRSAEKILVYTNKQLADTMALVSKYQAAAAELGESVKNNSPCIVIQKTISELEQRLDRGEEWTGSFSGQRREEAMAQLEKHQQSLRTCLARRI